MSAFMAPPGTVARCPAGRVRQRAPARNPWPFHHGPGGLSRLVAWVVSAQVLGPGAGRLRPMYRSRRDALLTALEPTGIAADLHPVRGDSSRILISVSDMTTIVIATENMTSEIGPYKLPGQPGAMSTNRL